MERTLGKERVLLLYLNTVDWGPGLCGARAAARTYFGKRPAQLSPLEAAWLAGILRAPHAAHERQYRTRTPDAERARWVLMQMRELPKHERVQWARRPLVLAAPKGGREAPLPPRANRTPPRTDVSGKAIADISIAGP
jgi:membrane peptidoglycan carboxypeptidase